MTTHQKPTAIERVVSFVGSVPSLILHSIAFIAAFLVGIFHVASWELVLLVLTTIVSLEAIYLAIFIQMTVNLHTKSLREVEEDIDEIQEDVEELGEDVEDIQEDLEELSEEEQEDEARKAAQRVTLEQLTSDVRRVLADLESLKEKK